jgi:hypothetical protein
MSGDDVSSPTAATASPLVGSDKAVRVFDMRRDPLLKMVAPMWRWVDDVEKSALEEFEKQREHVGLVSIGNVQLSSLGCKSLDFKVSRRTRVIALII